MGKKLILKDLLGVWLLFTACLVSGILLNEMQASPLPLVYSPPEARLDQAVTALGSISTETLLSSRDADLAEMQHISEDHTAIIIDARPDIFYRLGHIPSALSVPREDFEKEYQAMLPVLQAKRNKEFVVYCSGNDCQDSQMVADTLKKLGYSHVRLFRGGWSEWEDANLPVEKD